MEPNICPTVWTHLEYEFKVLSQFTLGDILSLEKVQKRATGISTVLKNIGHLDRLDALQLTKLGREEQAVIWYICFKIVKGILTGEGVLNIMIGKPEVKNIVSREKLSVKKEQKTSHVL